MKVHVPRIAPHVQVYCTTLENARIQLPSSASAVAITCTQPKDNEQVWYAGDLAESGKVFFHALMSLEYSNSILPNRYFRAHGTHDLETRQHCLRASRSLRRRSTMESVISGGRRGRHMVVSIKSGIHPL